MRRRSRPCWRIARRKGLFAGFIHLVFQLFFRLSRFGRSLRFRLNPGGLILGNLALLPHINRITGLAKGFGLETSVGFRRPRLWWLVARNNRASWSSRLEGAAYALIGDGRLPRHTMRSVTTS